MISSNYKNGFYSSVAFQKNVNTIRNNVSFKSTDPKARYIELLTNGLVNSMGNEYTLTWAGSSKPTLTFTRPSSDNDDYCLGIKFSENLNLAIHYSSVSRSITGICNSAEGSSEIESSKARDSFVNHLEILYNKVVLKQFSYVDNLTIGNKQIVPTGQAQDIPSLHDLRNESGYRSF